MRLHSLYALPPNRVRRNYRGGALLDMLEGKAVFADGDRPEDWIASTVTARNPGLPPIADEGVSLAVAPDGASFRLEAAFREAPEHFLGKKRGETPTLGFLSKLLDSGIRLHVQAHPTAAFARQYLNSPWGKLETYVVLGVRPGSDGYIRLGFQRPPSPAEWRRIVLEQDISAMDACFDKIRVAPGDVWVVPGGLPHAIGEGLLVAEIMEPTDLVVRCEFEREGIVVPLEARFMGRDPDFALRIFDFEPMPEDRLRRRCQVAPERVQSDAYSERERLIGPTQTECFEVYRQTFRAKATLPADNRPRIYCPVRGEGAVHVDGTTLPVKPGASFLIVAAAKEIAFSVNPGETLELLEFRPAP